MNSQILVLIFLSIFCVNSVFSDDDLKQESKEMKTKDFYSFEARSLQGERYPWRNTGEKFS